MVETTRLTRKDWVAAGLTALEENGAAALKADSLSRKLGVSRGSFYWHFENIGAFHDATLSRWEASAVDLPLIGAKRDAGECPSETLAGLIERAMSAPTRLERAVVAWAAESSSARKAVRRVNRRRIRILTTLLERIGCEPSVADARAKLLCAAYLGRMHLETNVIDAAATAELINAFARPGDFSEG